jgi:hypothetical protein
MRPSHGLLRSIIVVVAAVSLTAGLLAGVIAPAAMAVPGPAPDSTDTTRSGGSSCGALVSRTDSIGARVDAGLTELTWRGDTSPLTEAGFSRLRATSGRDALWLHSLAWLIPQAATNPGRTADVVAAYTEALPDPGPDVDAGTLRRTGWTEGQIRRRLETMECLYRRTGRAEFAAVAVRLGDALLDDRRYYGLPLARPHNHGAQSNLVLTRAGRFFDQPQWLAKAQERTVRDRAEVFAPCGMSDEQSSGYQALNVSLWERLSRAVGVSSDRRAQQALTALTRPDGVLEPIGDGRIRTERRGGGTLWCSEEGWAASTVDGMHYTARFGPRRMPHGHLDHGAVTWFTRGISVLEDRATAPKSDARALEWSRGASAHSTLELVGASSDSEMSARRTGEHAYLLQASNPWRHQRAVFFDPDRVKVTDSATSTASGTWIQHWQFSPGWEPVRSADGTATGVLVTDSGATVQVNCVESGRKVTPTPVRVRSFVGSAPAWAWDMQCRHTGTRVEFSSRVSWIGEAGTVESVR